MWKYCLLLSLLFACEPILAQSTNDWLNQGVQAYERNQFFEAKNAFESYLQNGGDPEKLGLPLAVTYYQTANLDKAHSLLSRWINDPKEPLSLYYYACVLHSQGKFEEAAEYYKKYLPFADQPAKVKKQILHCRSAVSLSAEKSLAFIDNMGEGINTPYDELAPVISPNHPGRIYYSSASQMSEGGKRDPNGYVNEEFGNYTFDMFRVDNEKGTWAAPQPLNPELNTARHELLYGFTGSGKVAFFFRGFNLKFGEIVTDTFKVESTPSVNNKNVFNSPADASFGDKDLHFINDSVFMFASVRPEGKGGYDLYICKMVDGVWAKPQPLGPEVNTSFHERTPHLSKSGNQLFFSSDRPEGFGGFDVYVTAWSNDKLKPALNLGKGINSACDDLFFVDGQDRFSAFLSSDRKSGQGGFDIYSAYFKESIDELITSSGPAPFLAKTKVEKPGNRSAVATNKKEQHQVSSLLFNSDREELTADHKEELNKVADLLKKYPQIDVNILSFTDYDGPRKYDLYFALKRAENVGKYLMEQGIPGERLYITGCGSSYPVYIKFSDAAPDPSPNQRIDLQFSTTGDMPVDINFDPRVPIDELENTPYQKFINLSKGLTYSVQIAATQQLYESPVLEKFSNPLIRTRAGNPLIKYTIGIFDSYDEARNLRYQLLKEGYKGAFITAYIDGIRKTRDQLRPLVDQYDGLRAYINVE